MSHRKQRRSRAERTVRISLAALAAGVGYLSVSFSMAQVIVDRDPALAHSLAPYDGRTAGVYARSLVEQDSSAENLKLATALSTRALREDVTALAAATTLATVADLGGDRATAQRGFAYATLLSRRDVRAQLWMIEEAVKRGDVRAALYRYDIALRVSPRLSDMLYPVLSSAIADPLIRKSLVRTLAGRPMWADSYINHAALNPPQPTAVALLLIELEAAKVPFPQAARANMIGSLIAAGQVDLAWSLYAARGRGADRQRSRDAAFTANPEPPTQLDWIATNDGGLTSTLRPDSFDFSASAGVGGPALQQVQLLSAGKYRLFGRSKDIEQPPSSRPYWVLRCADASELGRAEMPNSGDSGGTFSHEFVVPQECPAQILMLVLRPADAISGQSGQIVRVELARVEP